MRSLIFIFSMLAISMHAQTTNRGTVKVKKEADIPVVSAPLTIVEKMPEYPGGEPELSGFIRKNLNYSLTGNSAAGICYVTFVVETDGTLSNIQILKGIAGCEACNAEVLRVIKILPKKWSPGMQNGAAVPVQFSLPIRFHPK